jgi:hypothetical protein
MIRLSHPSTWCSSPNCPERFTDRGYWSQKMARNRGWVFTDEGIFCPDHTPGWVATWRARKAT